MIECLLYMSFIHQMMVSGCSRFMQEGVTAFYLGAEQSSSYPLYLKMEIELISETLSSIPTYKIMKMMDQVQINILK